MIMSARTDDGKEGTLPFLKERNPANKMDFLEVMERFQQLSNKRDEDPGSEEREALRQWLCQSNFIQK